jgi:hypothetical protein
MAAGAGAQTGLVRLSLPVHVTWTLLPAGLLIAGGLLSCGLLLLFVPAQRSLYSVLTVLLAIAALKTAHLGGYLIGTLLGLAAGAAAFSWVPHLPPARVIPPGFRLILGEADRRAGPAVRPAGALQPVPAPPAPERYRPGHAAQPGAPPWPPAARPAADGPWPPPARPAPRRHRVRSGPAQAQPAWYRARQSEDQAAREQDRD